MVRSIRTKLLIWFLVLAVVPLVAITYYATMTFQKNLAWETEERALTVTEATASAIQAWITEKIGRLEKLAQLEETKTLNPEAIVPILGALFKGDPMAEDYIFINENGDTMSPVYPSINVAERAYFKNAMATESLRFQTCSSRK